MTPCQSDASNRSLFQLFKATFKKWSADNASRLAAAFSYYAIFSIGPLLFIAVTLLGFIYGPHAARDQVRPQITSFVGEKAAEFIQNLIVKAASSTTLSIAGIISLALIFYAAANLFVSLQDSLNVIFGVQPKPGRGIAAIIKDRALSFLMVFIVGAFILATVVFSTLLAAVTKHLSVGNPAATAFLLESANFLISALIFTGVFALMFKFLPDIRIDWRDTLIGAAFTAALFTLARIGLGYYLGRSSTTSLYGAAGSLVVVMLFIYYSSQIFFLGAEFTQVWACRRGQPIVPSANAIAVKRAKNPKESPDHDPEGESKPGKWVKSPHHQGYQWSTQTPPSASHWPADNLHPPMQKPQTPARKIAPILAAAAVLLPATWLYLRPPRSL